MHKADKDPITSESSFLFVVFLIYGMFLIIRFLLVMQRKHIFTLCFLFLLGDFNVITSQQPPCTADESLKNQICIPVDCPIKYVESSKNFFNTKTRLCEPFVDCETHINGEFVNILDRENNKCVPWQQSFSDVDGDNLDNEDDSFENEDDDEPWVRNVHETNDLASTEKCHCNHGDTVAGCQDCLCQWLHFDDITFPL